MLALQSQGAKTCLRCRLRQFFRQASRTGIHPEGGITRHDLQRRFASDGGEGVQEHTVNVRRVGGPAGGGKEGRNRKGQRARQRQTSTALQIKSLGRESQIIVLRDIVEKAGQQDGERTIDNIQQSAKELNLSLSTEEVAALLLKKEPPPKPAEVDAAIEDHRPQEDVLSRQAFDVAVRALLASYNANQLNQYLHKHAPRHALKKQKKKKPGDSVKTQAINVVNKTAWYGGKTKITIPIAPHSRPSQTGQDVPTTKPSIDAKDIAATRRSGPTIDAAIRKRSIAENIFRLAWKVQLEEEAEEVGELELLLSPEQWVLLHTRNATDLFRVMRSRTFYQNSSFERDGDRGAIRIVGPRSEAEDIAGLFDAAFKSIKSIDVNLGPLSNVIARAGLRALEQVFTSESLRAVTSITGTSIHYDAVKKAVGRSSECLVLAYKD